MYDLLQMNELVKAIPDMEAELNAINSAISQLQITVGEQEAVLQKAEGVKPDILHMENCLQEVEKLKCTINMYSMQLSGQSRFPGLGSSDINMI